MSKSGYVVAQLCLLWGTINSALRHKRRGWINTGVTAPPHVCVAFFLTTQMRGLKVKRMSAHSYVFAVCDTTKGLTIKSWVEYLKYCRNSPQN